MTAHADDEHVSGSGAPSAELERRGDRVDGMRAGAHARRLEVTNVDLPRHPLPDRPTYFLSSLEPSGDYDAVIVAVTDGERRRYFTTHDGAQLIEVDEDSFERRGESGERSLLELDERELGELETELQFVRPVRGRDPIAEAAAEASEAAADAEAEAANEEEDEDMDPDPVIEEFEGMVMASTTMTSEGIEAAASESSGDAPAPEPEPAPVPIPSAASMSATDAIAQVSLAKGIAFIAHRGRLDRSGAPYIDHPGRMAEQFDPVTEPVEAAAAWLHDVLEHTAVTAQEMLEAGVIPAIVEIVEMLSRTPEVPLDEYYARIRRDPVARRVKLADIDDNTARWRLRRLEYDVQLRLVEQYRHARQALGAD